MLLPLGVVLLLAPSETAIAATLSLTRSRAIAWLESNQNSDGSWGSGAVKPVVTAEALLALAKANRKSGIAAERAKAWLLNHRWKSVDFEARAIRALEAADVDVAARATTLDQLGASGQGWGPSSGQGIDSYDTAIALAAIRVTGGAVSCESSELAEVFLRQRSDGGWSGDGVPVVASVSGSDRTTSAEIVRALELFCADWSTPSSPRFIAQKFLSTDQANGGALVSSGSDSLELASRLAGLHAVELFDAPLEAELLNDSRLTLNGVWSDTDAFVNAIGLLALTTKPNETFATTCQNPLDFDCDSFVDSVDAFPHDSSEHADLDSDGIGDCADPDRDGDGYCDPSGSGDDNCNPIESGDGCSGSHLFASDPTEHANSDGDQLGDNDDPDADADGLADVEELERGTDPSAEDTDGDGVSDLADACPLVDGGTDVDGDGVCAPLDECDNTNDPRAQSSLDIRNRDEDWLCDEADDDDDDDNFSDEIEVAWGSDPRDRDSFPDDVVATDPNGDFDQDGLTNVEEVSPPLIATNPYIADTDGDGALDEQELHGNPETDPNSEMEQPSAVLAVFGAGGAAEAVSPSGPFGAELTGSSVRATATAGQPTPVATFDAPHAFSSTFDSVNLAGFQPQTFAGRDLDGDGLLGRVENGMRTSGIRVDTDGDRFVDGASGLVSKTRYASGFDLDDDGFVEGEGALDTDPSDSESRIGRLGDLAPFGFPDGQLELGDSLVGIRLMSDPTLILLLSPDAQQLTLEAAGAAGTGEVGPGEALRIMNEVEGGSP